MTPWPQTHDNTPVPPTLLLDTPNRDELLCAKLTLDAAGIPYLTRNPNAAIFTTVIFGTEITGGLLYVPETLLEDAKYLLEHPFEGGEDLPEELSGL